MGTQKIVMRVPMENAEKRVKTLKVAVGLDGVMSAQIDGEKVVVVGDGIDYVALTIMLRKKIGFAELISVSMDQEWSKIGVHGALAPPKIKVFPATMKASSKSSSSALGTEDVDEKEHMQCFCQSTAPLETAWTKENNGHSFFSCPNYRTGAKCKNFEWKDKEFPPQAQCEISKLLCEKEDGGYEIKSEDELKLKILEEKLREKKRYLKSRELKLEEFEGNLRDRERELRQFEQYLREKEEKMEKIKSLSSKRAELLMIAVFLGLIFMIFVIRCM